MGFHTQYNRQDKVGILLCLCLGSSLARELQVNYSHVSKPLHVKLKVKSILCIIQLLDYTIGSLQGTPRMIGKTNQFHTLQDMKIDIGHSSLLSHLHNLYNQKPVGLNK